ncbi:short chain dehydrogenase [Legionella massiliensis]|uniref:Short chain dehydrogenase n=1 Tax=Legionella massiliensis TaxID=1034943 RepID=A0A078KX04_9GAMM|nr:SDR family NAD(P)-dependent oxidoreductase [Legionella massiliensis]CDZ77562.1 short chain dehydrogenase [Legionella massiliensis]CEE13300.1 short chain dehydrogenase [Legionella massiliensis]
MKNKKALVVITGASSGIGKALALKFSEEGHPCLLISRSIQFMPELKEREVS